MLQSDLCDYSDAYIIVKVIITVKGADNRDRKKNRSLVLKNNAPFICCILKINNVLIDNAGDLDVVTCLYHLIEYNKNYGKRSGSL